MAVIWSLVVVSSSPVACDGVAKVRPGAVSTGVATPTAVCSGDPEMTLAVTSVAVELSGLLYRRGECARSALS